MRHQPSRNYTSDDVVQTPRPLALRIINHFKPEGVILEPFRGAGNFHSQMPGAYWCELSEGKDFFDWSHPVDWILTNPPWSKIRLCLAHAMRVADNVAFLMTINHAWTKARVRDVKIAGFGIKEICLVEMPNSFPQSGFQLGVVHYKLGHEGDIIFNDISKEKVDLSEY